MTCTPGALEPAGPEQILLLVEPRLQLDHRGDRFAGLGRGHQRVDDRRLLAGAIERLLDRDDVGVLGRLAEEGDHHLEAFIGVVDDEILGPDRGETIAVMFHDPLREARRVGREFEVGPIDLDQLAKVGDADEPGAFRDQRGIRGEALADHRFQVGRRVGGELEPDDPPAAAALDRAAEVADQILGLLLHLDVAVADQPERAGADLLEAREKLVEMRPDRILDGDEAQTACPAA